MFTSLSDRLTATFKNLRGKGRLSESDVNKTVRDIRMALLDADVALPVVKDFTAAIRERALGAEVSEALNPGQQVVKIVNEELIEILGQHTRPLRLAKTAPTVIMLAGLQGWQAREVVQGPGQHSAPGGCRPAAAQCGDPASGCR